MISEKELLQKFELKNISFDIDPFEELLLLDAYNNEEIKIKLNTDVTNTFINWIKNKQKKKEVISINYKGGVRSGKSLCSLKHVDKILEFHNKDLTDINYIVCGNQMEYRKKLEKAEFGDYFQVDENAFSNSGEGTNVEMAQLKDLQNIIAKKNIGTSYITPKVFMSNTAEIGLSYLGKDSNNWLSKFLLYYIGKARPVLLGYVITDVGELFRKYGCYLYKFTGGCTNPKRLSDKEIFSLEEGAVLKYSRCIPEKYKQDLNLVEKSLSEKDKKEKPCPFYRVCTHPLCKYEHKKDTWIDKEMKGGLSQRVAQRYEVVLKLLPQLASYDIDEKTNDFKFKYKANNGKDLKNKIQLIIPSLTATKFTITEFEQIIEIAKSFTDLDFTFATAIQLEREDLLENLFKIENGDKIKEKFIKFKENK
ncbi:MAG: hypothetical protein ACOC22_01790 [bacterium]